MLPPLFFYSSHFPLSPPFQCVLEQFTFSKPPQLWFWTFSEVEWKLKLLWSSWALYFPSWSQFRSSILVWVDVTDHQQLWHTCGPWCTMSSFLLSKRGDYWWLSTFCYSKWHLVLFFGLRQMPSSSDSFCCFKGMVLSFAIWFHVCGSDGLLSSPSLHQQLPKHVLSSVSWGVCVFTGSGGRVFFFSL